MYRHVLILAAALWCLGSQAQACGTLELVKSMPSTDKVPLFRCGSEFNVTLERAHKSDWAGALKAYQARLKVRGRSYVPTADEKATLDYLAMMARAR